MQSKPLISVIVPVYDVEKYLARCIESIINQTYTNLEIILVDDGSPDKCGEICDSYARKDSRIKVLHKENGGVSSARNAGLDMMQGEYVGFVDSDDWIVPDMYEYLLSGMTDNVSVTICNYFLSWNYLKTVKHTYDDGIYSSDEILQKLFDDTYDNYPWNKLFLSALWKHIRFPAGRIYEDMLTIYKVIELSDQIRTMSEPKYYYLQRKDGYTGSNKTHANRYQIYQAVIDRYQEASDRKPEMKPALFSRIRKWYCFELSRMIVDDEENRELNWDLLEMLAPFVNTVKDELYTLEKDYSWIEQKKINAFSMGSLEGCKKCLRYHRLIRKKKRKKNPEESSMSILIEEVESGIAQYTEASNSALKKNILKEIYERLKDIMKAGYTISGHEFLEYQEALFPVLTFIRQNLNNLMAAGKAGRLWKIEFQLMSIGKYRIWKMCQIIDGIRKQKNRLRKIIKKPKQVIESCFSWERLQLYYYDYCLRHCKINNSAAILESRGGEDFAGNIYSIAKELTKRGIRIYLSLNHKKIEKADKLIRIGDIQGIQIIKKPGFAYYKAFATCKYCFTDMVYSPRIQKREGQIWTNVWHGTPLKFMENDIVNQRHKSGGAARDILRTDYFAAPSSVCAETVFQSCHVSDLIRQTKTVFCGTPRNQVLFDNERREVLRKKLGCQDKEVFVYMPVRRGTNDKNAQYEEQYSVLSIIRHFDHILTDKQIMYIRSQNDSDGINNYEGNNRIRPFPDDCEFYEFLSIADCLITDYSSLIFDFANTRRRIIVFAYDMADYLAKHTFYFPIDQFPFPIAHDYDELSVFMNQEKQYDDESFIQQFCTYDCQNATDKLLRTVIDGEEVCPVRVPVHTDKKQILLYDARFNWRQERRQELLKRIEKMDFEKNTYYYSFRTQRVKNCPLFIQNLPKEIRIFSLPKTVYLSNKEFRKWRKNHTLSEETIQREIKRALPCMPFDEVDVIDENIYDPYVQVLERYNMDRKKASAFGG